MAYLFGVPRFVRGGVPLLPARHKVSALLAYLAQTAACHDREALADLLYPGQDRDHALSDFRQILSVLRKTLGEGWLSADRDSVSLCRARTVWVDAHEFRRLVKDGRSLEQDPGDPGPLVRLGKAARLYRGDFLSGLHLKDSTVFEEWQCFEQESLRREYALVLQQLVRGHACRGEFRAAIEYGNRWLVLDTLDEAVHRELMRLYCLAGQRAAALRQYETCRSILARELDEAPDDETETLCREIRSWSGRSPCVGSGTLEEGAPLPMGSLPGRLYFLVASLKVRSGRGRHLLGLAAPWRRMIAARGTLVPAGRDDVLCALFPAVSEALSAALQAVDLPVNAAEAPAVRLALHAAAAERWGPGCLGHAAGRAIALMEAGHPAQILLSADAAENARDALPPGTRIRSLGVHRLKDLSGPQHVFQLVHRERADEFPPLATLDTRPNNLPNQPTPLIGRRNEVNRVIGLLGKEEVKLLTLTGPAGTGKTRLAIQAAAAAVDRFEHGVFVVDLAILKDPAQFAAAVAVMLRIPEAMGESRPPLRVLTDYLEVRDVLLVLDNFEHLLPAATEVAAIMTACPRLRILVTSREPLHLRGERQVAVLPLDLPPPSEHAEGLERYEAVQLFMERAQAVRADLSFDGAAIGVIAEICRKLDGLPLALELAAARVKVFSPEALVEMAEHRLGLLTGGSSDLPARQRSLESELDWSFELLTDAEKRLYRRLSVFTGGCTPEAASAVCGPVEEADGSGVLDGLSSLVDKSLLREEERDGHPRFRMLQTIQEHAAEKLLQSGERAAVQNRYALTILDMVEKLEPGFTGSANMKSFDRLDREYGNIGEALAWLWEEHRAEEGLRLAGALGWYWFRRGRFTEGYSWLERFTVIPDEGMPAALRAKAFYHLGWVRRMIGSLPFDISSRDVPARDCFRESLRLCREADDLRGVAMALGCLGWVEVDLSWEARWDLMEQSVRAVRKTGDAWATAFCLKMAYSYLPRHDRERAYKDAALRECIALARETGDRYLVSQALHAMGDMLMFEHDDGAAEPWYRESLRLARETDDKWSIYGALNHLGFGYIRLARIDRAEECFIEGLRLAVQTGARSYLGLFLGGLATVAQRKGMPARAVRLAGARSAAVQDGSVLPELRLVAGSGLDEETVRREWAIGRTMTSEQAIRYALEDAGTG